MISTRTHHLKTHRVGESLQVQNKTSGAQLTIRPTEKGLTLSGDNFHHTIEVVGDQVSIRRLDQDQPEATFGKLPYLEDSFRTAAGVAAILTGLPVHMISGEPEERVYVNLAHRAGMGVRSNGSWKGGRYRVTGMERSLNGSYTVHGTNAWNGYTLSARDSRWGDPPRPLTTDFTASDGRPLSLTSAFRRLSGTDFAEQIQSGVGEIWRRADRPGTAGEAAKTASYLFDTLYSYDEGYNIFHPHQDQEKVLDALSTMPPQKAWSILHSAASKNSSAKVLAKKLKA